MPVLDQATVRKLVSHARSRNGLAVPNTFAGPVYQYACWNWALSGGTLTADAATSNFTIIGDILQMNYNDNANIFPVGISPLAAATYPGPDNLADLQAMTNNLAAARNAGARLVQGNVAQMAFLTALARIMLRANGHTPILYAANNQYNFLVRSSEWWNTDHWALALNFGLPRGGANPHFFVQTVPDTPLRHACEVVWDEGLPGVGVGVTDLLQNQVNQLSAVPWSGCRANCTFAPCGAGLDVGAGQCRDCGFVMCEEHIRNASHRIGGYTCPQCLGTVELGDNGMEVM